MAKIYLQRHTQPDIEPGICYGQSDIALRKEYQMCDLKAVLERCKDIKVERIYSSPLRRCSTLAVDLQRHFGLTDITLDHRLKEMNFGRWEMLSWDEIDQSSEGKEWFKNYIYGSTPDGESFSEMVARAESFIKDIEPIEEDIMIVSHAGLIRALLVAMGRVEIESAFSVELEYGEQIRVEI